MKKLSAILLSFIIFFTCGDAFALHFENYEWGMPKKEAKKLIERKGASLPDDTPAGLVYHDIILDNPCTITLKFTPHSELLSEVTIQWEGTHTGQMMNELLTRKYGSPQQSQDMQKKFFWQDAEDNLTLDYSHMNTVVTYYSRVFRDKGEEENRDRIEKDIDRF